MCKACNNTRMIVDFEGNVDACPACSNMAEVEYQSRPDERQIVMQFPDVRGSALALVHAQPDPRLK